MANDKSGLTPRAVDFPRWYQEVVAGAEMAENGPVRGTMVIRPWGFGIWELLQAELDRRIKSAGAENAYVPLFIPESFLKLEASHVEGFSPELAVVTHGGGKQLEEPIVVRPTSETVVNYFFAKWIQSHRDLPLLINQWSNVVRWEMRTRLFLRTSEFLWQEGHTAHATEQEATDYALRILRDAYHSTMEEVMAVPTLVGHKTDRERFAGAVRTWTCEAMMGDGKALQLGTSHELGENFARAFNIQYSDDTGEQRYVFQTSWGASTRLIGGLIMVHGDDFGLRLPPALSPVHVVVMVVRPDESTVRASRAIVEELRGNGLRVRLDEQTDTGFGRRAIGWERKGVPVRIEVGPRDLTEGKAVLVLRHDRSKTDVPLATLKDRVTEALEFTATALFQDALAFREERTTRVERLEEAVEVGSEGFAVLPWSAVGDAGEERLGQAGITVRCLQRADGSLAQTEGEDLVAVVGKSY
ncbi:MAG: proline--tRNA ligase [Acidimicrobiales bacterium]